MAHPARILVVDDDVPLAGLLHRVLTLEGYEVVLAHSGEDALAQSRQGHYDLALVDVMLPGMDGYTLCRHLRRQPATLHLPVLMLTARGGIADKIAGFEAGADDYLTKPFQPRDLVYRLRSLLARAAPAPVERAEAGSPCTVLALFSAKGGVGKTTIATNLAIALHQRSGQRVALVDGDFYFGDLGVHLNLPNVRTVMDLWAELERPTPDAALAEQVLLPHASGLRVLLSPMRPHEAEAISTGHIEKMLAFLTAHYDWVIVDCQPAYDERTLKVLAQANEVLLVVTPELGPLKNTGLFLDWAGAQGYALDRFSVVLNRFNANLGIGPEEIERMLEHEVTFRLVSGGRAVVFSVNRGVPLILEQPDHPFSTQIGDIADHYLERTRDTSATVRLTRTAPSL